MELKFLMSVAYAEETEALVSTVQGIQMEMLKKISAASVVDRLMISLALAVLIPIFLRFL